VPKGVYFHKHMQGKRNHFFGKHHTEKTKQLIREANTGENNHNFKGLRKHNYYGYIMIYQKSHPKADESGRILEHRVKVENYLGRYLKKNELIHHINGKKDDNRLSNLYLFNRRKHTIYEKALKICPDLVKKLKSNLKLIKGEQK